MGVPWRGRGMRTTCPVVALVAMSILIYKLYENSRRVSSPHWAVSLALTIIVTVLSIAAGAD